MRGTTIAGRDKVKKKDDLKKKWKKVRSATYNIVSHYIIFYIIGLIISRSRTNPQAMFSS